MRRECDDRPGVLVVGVEHERRLGNGHRALGVPELDLHCRLLEKRVDLTLAVRVGTRGKVGICRVRVHTIVATCSAPWAIRE